MSLRVVHQRVVEPGAQAAWSAYAAGLRDSKGCLEAEVYRSLDDPERLAVVELWEDDGAFGRAWGELLAEGTLPPGLSSSPPKSVAGAGSVSEFYRHGYTDRASGNWLPTSRADEAWRVAWPARGQVRVVIQTSTRPTQEEPWPGGVEALLETRREPGCLQFEVFAGVEFEQDGLLLELWEDQSRYDAHWRLRTRVREAGGAGGGGARPVQHERGQGNNGVEFYRHQPFVHLYDRWLPVAPEAWSDTVAWPD
ncbi:antibiotic biosynthesis monooxygenase [Streptomyces sp. NPDC058457]|uniref:antibiotic biosynthesis monooxygenase n=1 Tax=Streptomyces sp. NPDC058457 TaxID=3346507 RepID=UPI00364AFB26